MREGYAKVMCPVVLLGHISYEDDIQLKQIIVIYLIIPEEYTKELCKGYVSKSDKTYSLGNIS
jgi:hypothetical protein